MRFSRAILPVLLITAVALIGGCVEVETGDSATITVTMVNASGNNIHILAVGEAAGSGNRLAPGQSRVALLTGAVVELQDLTTGITAIQSVAFTFYAVRNNVRMAATQCNSNKEPEATTWDGITVTYTEQVTSEKTVGSLGCSG